MREPASRFDARRKGDMRGCLVQKAGEPKRELKGGLEL
jgi:hypothetical protein